MPSFARLYPFLETALHILLILAVAATATFLVRRLTRAIEAYALKKMQQRGDTTALELEKNVRTIQLVLSRSLAFVIWAGAALAVLRRVGVDTSPFLTGAGVLGVAVGFGSQTLIKDVIAGLFLLIENQIRVGDTATINTVTGSVAEVNLRTTVLRAESGALHYFPNGSITALANLSVEFSFYILELVVPHETPVETAFEIIRQTGAELQTEQPYKNTMLGPVEIQGVDKFLEAGFAIRIRIKTTPGQHYNAGRELNRRLMANLRTRGIELPTRSLNLRTDPRVLQAIERDEIKNLVREVLAEQKTT